MIWADDRSIHVTLDGHHVKTVSSRLHEEHLRYLLMRGGKPAGPAPAAPALPRSSTGRTRLPENTAVQVDRIIGRDGVINFKGEQFPVSTSLTGQRVSVRLDGHLMHVIANNSLVKTLPYPITLEKRLALVGARQATSPLPPAPPQQAPQAERRVPKDGIVMVARQLLRVGATHAGKIVTIVVEDTHFRVLHGDQELSLHPRDPNRPIARMKPYARRR